MTDSPVALVPTRPDTEVAAAFKAELIEKSRAFMEVMDRIDESGLKIAIGIGKVGPLGRRYT